MDIELTVINDSHVVGYLASAVREGEIYMSDVRSMVDNVLSALRGPRRTCSASTPEFTNRLSRLNILDHGNPSGIYIGADWIDATTLPRFAPALGRLAGRFSPTGFVHVQHCQIGRNRYATAGRP